MSRKYFEFRERFYGSQCKKQEFVLNDGSIVTGKPIIQTRDNYIRPKKVFTQESRAQQQFKDECDINSILRRFEKTRTLPIVDTPPSFGDFSNVPSFTEALNLLNDARESFMDLSAVQRAHFDNDPAKFLDFCSNPANADKLVELGFMVRPAPTPEAPPQKVVIVNSEPPKPAP